MNTNSAANPEGRAAEAVINATPESLGSALQILEELHSVQLTIEKDQKEAEAANSRITEMLDGRLKLMEASFASQRMDELKELQRQNRLVLFAAGAFAVVGFVVLLFAAFVQWTTLSRITTLAARLPQGLGAGNVSAALGMGDGSLLPAPAAEQSTARFLGVIEKLEKRMDTIEKTAPHPQSFPEASASHESANGASAGSGDEVTAADTPASEQEPVGTVALLMNKGQTLLKLDKAEEAVRCFDDALAIEPANTDVLVRKGAALERLQKTDEAIACYDLAIAADSSLTMAYLYKGGVYNRMERYSEALECYEQALKTQQKSRPENVTVES